MVALAVGLLRGAGFLRAGGDELELLDGEVRWEVVEGEVDFKEAVDFEVAAWMG